MRRSKEHSDFMRTAAGHPLGKCDEARLDVPMPQQLLDDIKYVARLKKSASHTEWVRNVLEKVVSGEITFIERRTDT